MQKWNISLSKRKSYPVIDILGQKYFILDCYTVIEYLTKFTESQALFYEKIAKSKISTSVMFLLLF